MPKDTDGDVVMAGCLGIIVAFFIAICMGGCFVASGIEYSSGFRDGRVQKLSERGVVFKTIEGEAILGGLDFHSNGEGSGSFTQQRFYFTVSDPAVRQEIESLPANEMVRLHYSQKLSKWEPRGESSYFVTRVERLRGK